MSNNGKKDNPHIKVSNRKIQRNRLKNKIGSNKIQKSWMNIQINRCKKFIADLNKLIEDKKVIRTKDTNRFIKSTKNAIAVRLKKAQC